MAADFKKFSPGLFDLAQDISLGLPADILRSWLAGSQTANDAHNLLTPLRVTGTTVVSDTAGLTKLTREKGLVEILSLIDVPKRLVHRYGHAIGGSPIGIWAADNTQMWYPAEVTPAEIARMLLAVQDAIEKRCGVKIGMGAHRGTFYNLGGGLFGDEADMIEEVAENSTDGGEIVVTDTIEAELGAHADFCFEKRTDVAHGARSLFRLVSGPAGGELALSSERYPIPYSAAFHNELIAYSKAPSLDEAMRIERDYSRESTVVLVERARESHPHLGKRILDDLAVSLFVTDLGRQILGSHQEEIKIAGALGIYVFDDPLEAFHFAQRFQETLAEAGIVSRIGIDSGTLFVFDLPAGGRDIAGAPVNIASKLGQDKGEFGSIAVSLATTQKGGITGGTSVSFEVSGARIHARIFSTLA